MAFVQLGKVLDVIETGTGFSTTTEVRPVKPANVLSVDNQQLPR